MTNETKPGTVEVAQADKDAARDWNIECRRCSEYPGDFEADLAEAFARHRLLGVSPGDTRSAMERLGDVLRGSNLKPTQRYLSAAFLGYDYARRLYTGQIALAAQSQPAAIVQELEDKISDMIESALARHGVDLADVEGTRDDAQAILAALTAEPAAKVSAVGGKHAIVASLIRDAIEGGTDEHADHAADRIMAYFAPAQPQSDTPPSPQPDMGSGIKVPDGVWSKPEYAVADQAYQEAMAQDSNDRMSALASAVDAALAIAALSPPASQSVEKMTEALRRLLDEKAPKYHDCIDAGESECAWCEAEEALSTLPHKGEGRD